MALTARGQADIQLWTRTRWQKALQNSRGLKNKQTEQVKLMDGPCEVFCWLTAAAFQSEGVSPGRTVPAAVSCSLELSPKTPAALLSRKTPTKTTTFFHSWYLTLLTWPLHDNDVANKKGPRHQTNENQSLLPSRLSWSSCPLASSSNSVFVPIKSFWSFQRTFTCVYRFSRNLSNQQIN